MARLNLSLYLFYMLHLSIDRVFDEREEVLRVHEGLRMSDEHVSVLLQMEVKLFHQFGLGLFVEIDHDIAAEDDVEGLLHGKQRVHEVELAEGDHVLDLRACLVPFCPAHEVFGDVAHGHGYDLLARIYAPGCLGEDLGIEIGCEDLYVPTPFVLKGLSHGHGNAVGLLPR